jgi:hypothetical protein
MRKEQEALDQGFLRAYSAQKKWVTDTSTSSSAPLEAAQSVRLLITASADQVRAAFDPVSFADEQATRELNEVAKLGYSLPKALTR